MTMEKKRTFIKNKGGRPKKGIKKDCKVSVRCSIIQRKALQQNAKIALKTVSEFLLQLGLSGKIDRLEKPIPKEILQLVGALNHIGANLNQIAKKRNGIEPLNAFDRAELKALANEITRLAKTIKNYFK
jgi:hypothetical protein